MTRRTFLLSLLPYLLASLVPLPASAQGPATGTPPFGSFGGGPEVINLANLNSHIPIPVLHKPGRGLNFTYDMSYDTSVWYRVTSGGTTSWQPVGNWGWRGVTEAVSGSLTASGRSVICQICNGSICYYPVGEVIISNWVYHDVWGVPHPFSGEADLYNGNCPNLPGPSTGFTSTSNDGSGYTLTVTVSGSNISSAIVTARDGTIMNPPPYNSTSGSGSDTDRNGNQITVSSSGVFTDTLGTTALTVAGSGTPTSPMTFTYTAPSGASAVYTMKYTTYSIQTNFGCSGITEYGTNGTTTANLVSEIDLPDSSKYTFAYEATPGHSGFVTGRLASVTLPTGGTISYSYSGGNNGITCSDGSAATLTRTTPDGTWTYARTQVSGSHWQTKITDPTTPTANQTLIDFQKDGGSTSNFYETQRQVYQGSTSGTLLATTTNCYNGNTSSCTTTAVSSPISRRTQTIQLGNLQCKHDRFWNSYGMLTEADDYDYAAGAPGPLLRQTLITYANLGSNLNAFTQTVTVKDGSGNIKSRQDTNYDQYSSFTESNCITGAPQHDDSGHGCSFTARANATSVTTYTNPSAPSGGITQNFTYDSLGNVRTLQDALNNTTTLAYSPDAWANSYCNPSTTSYAYPVSASNALSQTTSFTYFACSGQPASVKDPNNQTTSVSYDSLLRPTQENFPDGGQTTLTYNSLTSITTTTKMNSSQNIVGTLLLDGLGRTIHQQLNSDPQGVDYADTVYDALGRVASVSNPYRTTSDATYGVTSYQYDALGRVTKVIPPDGSSSTNNISVSYSTNATTVTDQASKKRQSTMDSLGRLTQVTEDPGGLGYVTTYSYDALSNLTNVTQNGGRQRTFGYDALSRLTSETNPESGTVTYGYDNNSNLTSRQAPAPNQTGSSTVTTTYSYDALNRLTQKSYSDGTTPTSNYYYDQQAPWGWNLSNYIGRLTEESTSVGGTAQTEAIFNYDPMGRVTNNGACTPLNCVGSNPAFHITPTYDLAGNTTSLPVSYGSNLGYTISYAYNTAVGPTSVTSNLVDAQHPATLFILDTTYGYFPHGALRKAAFGNGLTQSNVYNNRLQPCLIDVNNNSTTLQTCNDSTPSGNVLDLWMGYNAGTSDNGNVMNWNATGNQSFIRTFTYDSLNRVSTLNQSSGNATNCSSTFSLSWTYDAWGNRTDQNVTGGTCNAFHQSVNTLNQLVGPPYQYDAAGNMTADGNHTYFYDAESRLVQVDGTSGNCSTATVCYLYDAEGHRVRRSLPTGQNTDYIFGLDGNVQSEWNSGGAWGSPGFWGEGYVYLGAQQLAHYHGGTTLFVHTDHLGSTRLQTDLSQNVQVSYDYLPFGEKLTGGSGTWYNFTGDERDPADNLDRTWFRQYSSSLGRWMHPDPAGLAAVDMGNPQSWNRYAYVFDSPLDFTDPLGLCGGGPGIVTTSVNGVSTGSTIFISAACPDDPSSSGGGGLGLGGRGFAGGGPFSEAPSDRPKHNGGSRIECATKFGQNHSLAAAVGAVLGDKVGNNFVTQLLLGNTVSSLAKIGTDIFGSTSPDARQVASMALKGAGQGIPGLRGPANPIVGPIRDAAVGPVAAAAYNSVIGAGSQTLELGISASGSVATTVAGVSAQTAATAVAFAKFGFDGTTFVIGLISGCHE